MTQLVFIGQLWHLREGVRWTKTVVMTARWQMLHGIKVSCAGIDMLAVTPAKPWWTFAGESLGAGVREARAALMTCELAAGVDRLLTMLTLPTGGTHHFFRAKCCGIAEWRCTTGRRAHRTFVMICYFFAMICCCCWFRKIKLKCNRRLVAEFMGHPVLSTPLLAHLVRLCVCVNVYTELDC